MIDCPATVMDNRLDIASATGVDLHLHIAGPGARSFAFVIDWHIRLLLTLAWMAAVALVTVGDLSLPEGDSFEFDSPAQAASAPLPVGAEPQEPCGAPVALGVRVGGCICDRHVCPSC